MYIFSNANKNLKWINYCLMFNLDYLTNLTMLTVDWTQCTNKPASRVTDIDKIYCVSGSIEF